LNTQLRISSLALCLAGLSALALAPSGGIALAQTSQASAHQAPARPAHPGGSSARQAASARPAGGDLTLGRSWEVQSSAPSTDWTTGSGATQDGAQISAPGFATAGWLPVTTDDAGAVGTEVEALLQNGVCPLDPALQPVNQDVSGTSSIFYSNNMQQCFGAPQTQVGADTSPLFDMPWWFRTDFTPDLQPGQDAKLVINGVMGQADVWVNGTEVATQATVEGDYTSYTFDVTNLIRPGTNSLALELYPNNPSRMFTLDDVDWNQIAPDNNTGIQFPVQLRISAALGISNVYVTQDDAPDLSSAALTVNADVANNTARPQAGQVSAVVTPPGGGAPILVSQPVTLAAGAARTVTFRPASFPQLVVRHPQLWWPYQMGGQPLYRLSASVSAGGGVSATAPPVPFGIRSVTTYLTAPSSEAPDGVRVFEVNGVPFDFRGGGWSENLFLHYSAADLANQISLIKSMGIDGIRTEGKEMPQNFYDQMDRAGILVDAGFQCCDKWAPSGSGRGVTAEEYRVMYLSSLTIGQQLRDHPSVLNFSWSDNPPINEQEVASTEGFDQSGFQDPIISSAEYNTSAILGPSGEKEGPYDWVPPSYFYDTTHSSNNANDDDSTLTNVGGSFGFDSEQGSGDTVPTMDSIQRFLSPADQAALWQQPDAHQYHTNYESTSGQHSGYSFGTLDNLDTAIQHRYGSWTSLSQYVQEAQVQNYESTRAQFEAYIDHWDNYPTPSTGTVYWQLNKGWPTLLWDLYNYDYDTAGSYFGAKKANEDLHVLYAYDTGSVTIDNLTGVPQPGLSVQSRVYDLSGKVLDDQTAGGLSLAPQGVRNSVLTPKVPATTTPPAPAQTYFVELILRQHGAVIDRNVYWLSTQPDVIDWDSTEGNPQADNGTPLSQYADLTGLQSLPSEPVGIAAATQAGQGGKVVTSVTITNPSANSAVAFFLRADVRRGSPDGTAQSGDNQVLPITWSDNDVTLWPGESQTLTATYRGSLLNGATPVVSVSGWNVPGTVVAAARTAAARSATASAEHAAGIHYLGEASGTPRVTGTPQPGTGAAPARALAPRSTPSRPGSASSGPAWTITSVANSPTATPSTSFTQGDTADTYTLTVTNSGHAATDGSTPVTLTDVVDPNISMVSMTGPGWTCDTSNDPTEVCTETGGSGGGPAVLAPGQSYPPVTLTVSVPQTAGFGTQDSTAGLHVTNAVTVTGGAAPAPTASVASQTPIAGLPDLTADNAVASAFRQGDAGDQYQITVINSGGGPTSGSAAAPVTATITALPAGETIQALYGSGWTCSQAAITAPSAEPADTCYRSDALPGENGEEPPITLVVSVASNAPASGNETVQVSGGGDAAPPKSVSAATTTGQAADLNVASTHAGSFAQGDSADTYGLTVSNVNGPNSASGGPSLGLVSVEDSLPWGLTATAVSGTGWSCDVASVTCYRSDALAAGSAYPPITLTVSVAGNAPASVTNAVTVSGGGMTSGAGSSTASGGQTGSDPTTITQTGPAGTPPAPPAPPKLAVTSTHPGSFGQGDAADSYTLTVSDGAGAGPASGLVTVTDALPAGLTPTEMSGRGWTCSLAPPVLPGSVNTFEPLPACYRLGSLAAGAAYPPITLTVAVANNAAPSVSNAVSVSGGGNAGVAAGTDATTVTQVPALVVTSYDTAGGVPYAPFTAGDGAAASDDYDITVANDGFAATSGTVTLTVSLPAGLTALAMSGAGWSCQAGTVTCTLSGGGTLSPGQRDVITLRVAVAGDAPASLPVLLQASGGGQVPAAGLDTDDLYGVLGNGGAEVGQTSVMPRG
jgi:exo-1,4-beta-D-glucosaminidase